MLFRSGYNRGAGTLPADADRAYKTNAVFDGKYWWALGKNKALYRYCNGRNGFFHWCGSSKDSSVSLGRNRVPSDIVKHFGLSRKGKL